MFTIFAICLWKFWSLSKYIITFFLCSLKRTLKLISKLINKFGIKHLESSSKEVYVPCLISMQNVILQLATFTLNKKVTKHETKKVCQLQFCDFILINNLVIMICCTSCCPILNVKQCKKMQIWNIQFTKCLTVYQTHHKYQIRKIKLELNFWLDKPSNVLKKLQKNSILDYLLVKVFWTFHL